MSTLLSVNNLNIEPTTIGAITRGGMNPSKKRFEWERA